MHYTLYTDGASKGNPGKSGAGFVVYEGEKIIHEGIVFLGIKTNNQAEYMALILGLEYLKQYTVSSLSVYTDSELMVRQIEGRYKVKNKELFVLFQKVKTLLPSCYSLQHIDRLKNTHADRLANFAIS